jgi:DNA replication initiation complex subunit (GINS family)
MQRNAMYREKESASLKQFQQNMDAEVAELRKELAAKETELCPK